MIRKIEGRSLLTLSGWERAIIGAAIIKHFERTERRRHGDLMPGPLVPMWERYSHDYELNAQVVSIGMLAEGEDGENFLLDNEIYGERDFLLIDESHNLRNVGNAALQVGCGLYGSRS